MFHPLPRSLVAMAATGALALAGCSAPNAIGANGLPEQMVWTTYGTGTSTYADVAAVADAITTAEGTPVRVITSDTGIGRLAPLREGPAQFSRTGDEYIYSFEGDEDFTTERWGPQETRVAWAPVAPHDLMVRADSGIETFEDLAGKKFPRVTANPSVNNKLEAFLAYGGLTFDDVELVDISYGDQPAALQSGQLDVLFQQVYGSSLYELESSVDVRWLSMDDTSPDRLAKVAEISPSVEIGEFADAPGQPDGEPDKGMLYAVPVVTYADSDPDMVYASVRAIADNYEQYADSTATTDLWSPEAVLHAPKQVPFHDGLIRYLEEEGLWSDEAQRLNDELVERGEQLRAGWEDVVAENSEDDLRAAWSDWKSGLPAPDPIIATDQDKEAAR